MADAVIRRAGQDDGELTRIALDVSASHSLRQARTIGCRAKTCEDVNGRSLVNAFRHQILD